MSEKNCVYSQLFYSYLSRLFRSLTQIRMIPVQPVRAPYHCALVQSLTALMLIDQILKYHQ